MNTSDYITRNAVYNFYYIKMKSNWNKSIKYFIDCYEIKIIWKKHELPNFSPVNVDYITIKKKIITLIFSGNLTILW